MKIFFQIIVALSIINISFAQTNYYVSPTGSDANDGSQANPWATIEYAVNNVSNPSVDGIIINISGGIYDLSNDQIDIDRNFANLTLIGEGSDNTFIQSAVDTSLSTSRVIEIYSGNNASIKNLTVRYGRILVTGENGGGILNSGGALTLDYCNITENSAGFKGDGGGVANINGNLTINNSIINYNTGADSGHGAGIGSRNGILSIYNSTISYNSTPFSSGGIAVLSNGANAIFNMENSTVYGNTADHFGGIRVTVFGEQPSIFDITTNINSCTIFNNSATDFYGGIGLSSPSNFNIKNSIVAGNFWSIHPDDIRVASSIPISITSGGYNIFQTVSDSLTINGEQNNGIGLDPNLLPLAENNTTNGTQTCATVPGSPAIDAIPGGNGAPLFDQRGYQRFGEYDIGAYELVIYAPTNLTAVADTFAILLNWTDNSTDEMGFYIERKNGDTLSVDPFFVIDTVLADINTYNDLGRTPNTTYTYRVQAFNLIDVSPYSNEITATTLIPEIYAPTNLTAVADTFAILLNWTDNSADEMGFYIERKNGDTLSVNPFFVIDTVLADINSYNDLGRTPNTTYTYRVQAFNLTIVSAYSNQVTATTIIPVELTSFAANVTEREIYIIWSTATELNNRGFELERKLDSEWQKVAFIEGGGTTTEKSEYSYLDNFKNNGFKGTVRYRLKQIDFDGTISYSNIILVIVDFTPKEFALYQNYPNPFNPVTKIRYHLPKESKVVLKIYNILGSEVMELINEQKEAGIYEVEFNASNLSSGTYIYKISAENFVQTKKMILLK